MVKFLAVRQNEKAQGREGFRYRKDRHERVFTPRVFNTFIFETRPDIDDFLTAMVNTDRTADLLTGVEIRRERISKRRKL